MSQEDEYRDCTSGESLATPPHASHRETPHSDIGRIELDSIISCARTHEREERKEVIIARMRETRYISPRSEFQETLPLGRVFACCESCGNPSIELSCPWMDMLPRPVYSSEIMDDIATSDDEYPTLAKYRKRLTELYEFTCRCTIVQTHRDDWHIGTREEMDKSRPHSMIESTSRIWGYFWLFLSFRVQR